VTDRQAGRALIVEDEILVAMELEDLLTAMGHQVIGSAARMGEALELARDAEIDFAVLDINVGGVQSFPVADILRERGIPFFFTTGYGAAGLMDGFRHETTLRKPYDSRDLARAIAAIFPPFSR
jgi:DNA-binding response OmpR family regulator